MAEKLDLESCLTVAVKIAREAGKIARDARFDSGNTLEIENKLSTSDIVTQVDKQVEELILSQLKSHFPTHKLIGEECTTDEGCPEFTDEPTWMVDPIDGTTNFVHGFPFSAVSIGLTVEKTPVVGVVYNFMTDQLFSARKGGGATMNGRPIHVSKCTDLTSAMLLSEFGGHRPPEVFKPKIDCLYNLAVEPKPVHGIRMTGSAAVNLCMVASGIADGYFEYGIHCWDIAAGVVIAREAGAVCLFPTGEPLDLMARGVLCAANNDLATKLAQHMPLIQLKRD